MNNNKALWHTLYAFNYNVTNPLTNVRRFGSTPSSVGQSVSLKSLSQKFSNVDNFENISCAHNSRNAQVALTISYTYDLLTGCLTSLERILKRITKGLFPWRYREFGTKYHSRSGSHHQRQFLRLTLRLVFLRTHLICSFHFYL